MWSRILGRKVVMTDSSEGQAAAQSGIEETNANTPAAGAVVVGVREEGSGASSGPTVPSSTITTSRRASLGGRRLSASSTRSIEPVHQSPGEGIGDTFVGERTPGERAASTDSANDSVSSQDVAVEVEAAAPEVRRASRSDEAPSATLPTLSDSARGERLTPAATLSTAARATASSSTATETESAAAMSGNPDFHSSSTRSSGSNSNSTSSSRRQRNGLFGINLNDLNFDPSSWLSSSNAGRSISSLSVLPDWVRHPVSIIPNRSSDSPTSQSSSGLAEGRQHQHHHHPHHFNSSAAGGGPSRLVSHHHASQSGASGRGDVGGAQGSNWNSASFQSSSSIPSNMHHHHHHTSVPLRTRHSIVSSMRSVDEDLDADYNPVSTIDIGAAGRDHRDDTHSYVIDMGSPMGGWVDEDAPTTSQALRGSSSGVGVNMSHVSNSTSTDTNGGGGIGGENIGGSRRSVADINLQAGAVPGGGGPGIPGQSPPGSPDGNPPSMADAATGANERTRAAEILRDAPETRAFINEISRYTTIRPFIIINFLKGVFDHGTSILAFLALVVTFSHANSMVKKEVSKQRKRNLLYLTMIVCNLLACVAFIYYIFNEMELYYALMFLPTRSDLSAFWSLMWAVGVTDYVAKFATVFIKIIVVSLPGCVLPFQKRGKVYLFIEYTSQLYRSFLPVSPWLTYLVSAYEGTARMFGLLLAGIYVIFKITDSVKRFKDWLKAFEKLLSNVHYGTNPTAKQLDGAGTICPICHDNFANPTRLQCSHIFCEECVATWFDRERTCPMCRAKVVDDPTYRDGSTSQYIQLF